MTRKPLEPAPAVLPPPNFYAWPLGMVAVALICYGGMWAYQHMNYTCVAFKAMCEERERIQHDIPTMTPISMTPAQRWGPSHALQMPDKPRSEWVTPEEGCPPDYVAMNGACWVEVGERAPCATSYFRNGKCWVPVRRSERPGVTNGDLR